MVAFCEQKYIFSCLKRTYFLPCTGIMTDHLTYTVRMFACLAEPYSRNNILPNMTAMILHAYSVWHRTKISHFQSPSLSPVSSPAPLKLKWSPVEQKGCCVKLWMGSPLKPSWHSQACLHSTTVTQHTTMRTWCLETQYKQII